MGAVRSLRLGAVALVVLGTIGLGASPASAHTGLSLAVGAVYGLLWLGRAGDRGDPAEGALATVARRVLAAGVWVALVGVAIRWVTTVLVLSGSYGGGRSAKHVVDAVTSSNGTLGLIALLATFAVMRVSRPVAAPPAATTPDRARLFAAAVGLAIATLFLVVGGHASIEPDPSLAVGLDTAHVLAAAAWLGPLALVLAARRSRAWRGVDRGARIALVQRYFAGYAAVAGWSFAVLVVTGLRPLW